MKAIILILAASVGTVFAEKEGDFEILFEVKVVREMVPEDLGGHCEITFFGKVPEPATVDKIVRASLQSAALVDPTHDIRTWVRLDDPVKYPLIKRKNLDSNQYSGELFYRAADKRIMTRDEFDGVKTTTTDVGAYYVEIREYPKSHRLSLSIVFPTNPAAQQALDAVVAEIQKRTAHGVDIDAFPKYGDKKIKTSWKQMPDTTDGGFVYYRYIAADRIIYNKYLGDKEKSAVIKKLP